MDAKWDSKPPLRFRQLKARFRIRPGARGALAREERLRLCGSAGGVDRRPAVCTACLGVELAVDDGGDGQQARAVHLPGQRVTEFAVDPVEHGNLVFLAEAERGVAWLGIPERYVQRDPLAPRVLIHELCHRSLAPGQ